MPRRQPETPEEAQAREQKMASIIANVGKKMIKEPVEVRPGIYLAKIQDDWLPLPSAFIKQLGWKEGDEIEMFPTHEQVILRRKDALKDK